jgi:uncharacterized membrane protein (UPF0127 family)
MSDPGVASRRCAVGMLILVVACGMNAPKPAAPRPPTSEPRVIFPDGTAIHVEIASDDATRQQGLMYRDQMAPDRGMIFLFTQSGNYPFWMKNTLIPLDMIWLDEQHRIVHISQNVPPCKADPCPSYDPGAFAKAVLEVAGGVAGRHGLANGQTLRFEAMDNVIVR